MKPVRVGLVITHSYAYYRRILRGIGRHVEIKPQWEFISVASGQQLLQVPRRDRPDGLIASVNTKLMLRALSSWRRPVVNVSAIFPGLGLPRVGVDNARVGRLAAAHFLERGLRHFGFIGPPDHLYSAERGTAFCQAVREAGHAVACYESPAHLPFDPLSPQWDLDPAIRRWLRALPRPAGVFVPNDRWGVQVAEECRRAGRRVPEDVCSAPAIGPGRVRAASKRSGSMASPP